MEASNSMLTHHRANVEKILEVNQMAGQRMRELGEEAADAALKIFSTSMASFRTQLSAKSATEAFELQTKLMQDTLATATQCANRMLELEMDFAKTVVATPAEHVEPARPAKPPVKPS